MSDAIDPKKRQTLYDISAMIEQATRAQDPTLFFACFMEMGGEVVYLANGARPEILKLLRHWVDRTTFKAELKKAAKDAPQETSERKDARLAVDRLCGQIGKKLTLATKVALFFFKNNEHVPGGIGINAYYASMPNARNRIDKWLKGQEQPS